MPHPLRFPEPVGESLSDAMLETDHDRPSALNTLDAEDLQPDDNLDDRLLRRELKSRIFGSQTSVRIGRYEILGRIGRGGMGTVYVAHDPELDRKVALKVLRPDRRSGQERMLHEARALARLSHPNVVTVHEVGLHDDRVFVAMELVQGNTLRAWLERSPSRRELYTVFMQAAEGLRAAHRAGLVHRDFKPDNVLIGDDGRVRVVDFGVVKATDSLGLDVDHEPGEPDADEVDAQPELTRTGQLLGTPAYMAAEQFLGESVDARTDVFAFCVTLYEALTGRRPFPGEDAEEVCQSVLRGEFPPLGLSDVPPPLPKLVEQGLSRNAADRPPSLDAMAMALTAAATGSTRPASASSSKVAWVAGGIAGVLGLTMLAGGFAAYSLLQADDEPGLVVADHPEPPSTNEPLESAFAGLLAAEDDQTRLERAEGFLETHGEQASEVRRAVAHSMAGDVYWRTSCAKDYEGLCIEEQSFEAPADPCFVPRRGPITRQARDEQRVEAAQRHLQAAAALGGVEPPEDEAERQAFGEAIGRARTQLADAELETYLELDVPEGLDFSDAADLSSAAFGQFFNQLTRDAARLSKAYLAVKAAKDPHWTLVAAGRTGMLMESASETLARAPVYPEMDAEQRENYCSTLGAQVIVPARKSAHDAYAYCVEKAEGYGFTDDPAVTFCRDRLALYPATAPEAG